MKSIWKKETDEHGFFCYFVGRVQQLRDFITKDALYVDPYEHEER